MNHSKWAAPSFVISKKDGTVHFIDDLQESNKCIKRCPCPLPKMNDLMWKLKRFQWATSLDLNVGHCHVELDADSQKLCTLVFSWGKCKMQCLPVGSYDSPDIFQEKMSGWMEGPECAHAHTDNPLVIMKGSFKDHLTELETVLECLQKAGSKVNINKSLFCQVEIEYLGHWIMRDHIEPMPKKVEAMERTAKPKNETKLCSFVGLINYFCNLWMRHSEILAPLTNSCGANSTWKWGAKE